MRAVGFPIFEPYRRGMPIAVSRLVEADISIKNPFDMTRVVGAESTYTAWQNESLFYPLEPGRSPSRLTNFVHHNFRAQVLNPDFSCVAGRSAIVNNSYRFGLYSEMNDPATTISLAHDLWEYVQERPAMDTEYATFVASFVGPVTTEEHTWETRLWSQLQSLHDVDHEYHAWDSSVSSDPNDPEFSFSFAGTAFFVIGMHPASSRYARKFAWPTLVFNAHSQFEQLREKNKFERMKATIRTRDHRLQGSINPNLSTFGEESEARQYSARAVEKEWRCPFSARTNSAVERPV